MAAEQQGTAIAGISSRRTACDKCRFAKARCLRAQHSDQSRCERCSRTDSLCFTSPIFRLRSWQPPAPGAIDNFDHVDTIAVARSQPKKRQRRHGEQPTPEASSVSTPSHSNGTLDEELLGSGAAQSPAAVANNLARGRDWNANAHTSISHPLDVFYGHGLGDNLNEALGNVNHDFDLDLSDQFFSTGASPSRVDSAASPSSFQAQSTQSPRGIGELGGPTLAQAEPGSATGNSIARPADDTPMRSLSKLHHELMATLSHLEEGSPEVTMKTIFEANMDSFTPSAMEQILNRTTEFAAVLKLLAESHLPPAGASSADWSMQITQNKRQGSSSSSSIYDHDSVLGSPVNTTISAEQSPSSTTSPRARRELDTPSLLLILAIYMRLLKLHSIVFARLHKHLKELSESNHPHLHPFPRFSINGTFSMPSQSGNLQILILIEVVASLFERLDALLGLPKELRLSRRRREQQGLLSAANFLDLTSSILKKDDQGGHEVGKGGIKALRRHLAGAKQLLRECIDP